MRSVIAIAAMILCAGHAEAFPGVGDPIYGATVEKGATEFEARYGRLTGKAEDGADGLVLEAEHGFGKRFAAALLLETGRAPGASRTVDAIAVEGIYALGHNKSLGFDTAIYAEYKYGFGDNPDEIEIKGLFQHRAGGFDGRLNLIAEKPLRASEPTEFGYAASADWAIIGDDIRIGLAAFGDLGTVDHFAGREQHFIGPEAKFEIEHIGPGEIEIEVGWLRAFGAARDFTDGQARLLISYEGRF